MKKVLSIILTAVMMITMATGAFACEGATGHYFELPYVAPYVPEGDMVTGGYIFSGSFCVNLSSDLDKAKSLVEAIRMDMESLTCEKLSSNSLLFCVSIRYLTNDVSDILLCNVTPNYINTIAWMQDNGFGDFLKINPDEKRYVVKMTGMPYMDFWDKEVRMDMKNDNVVIELEGENVTKYADYLYETEHTAIHVCEQRYLVFRETDAEQGKYLFEAVLRKAQVEELLEIIK